MRKATATICGLGCLIALVLAGGEMPDGSCNLPWTLGFLALAVGLGWAFNELTKKEERRNG